MVAAGREHRFPIRIGFPYYFPGKSHVFPGVFGFGFRKNQLIPDSFGKQILPDGFRFGHRFVAALPAGGNEPGFPAGLFFLAAPELQRLVRPSAQQRRQRPVLPEPAPVNDNEILVRRGPVLRRQNAADDRPGQHALAVDKEGGICILKRVGDPVFHLRPHEIPGKPVPSDGFSQNQKQTDQQAQHILNPEALMPQQRDIADRHGSGKRQHQRHGQQHKTQTGAADAQIGGHHGIFIRPGHVGNRHEQHFHARHQGKQGKSGIIDRSVIIKRGAFRLKKMPEHDGADQQTEQGDRYQQDMVAGKIAGGAVKNVLKPVHIHHAQRVQILRFVRQDDFRFSRLFRIQGDDQPGSFPFRLSRFHHFRMVDGNLKPVRHRFPLHGFRNRHIQAEPVKKENTAADADQRQDQRA